MAPITQEHLLVDLGQKSLFGMFVSLSMSSLLLTLDWTPLTIAYFLVSAAAIAFNPTFWK